MFPRPVLNPIENLLLLLQVGTILQLLLLDQALRHCQQHRQAEAIQALWIEVIVTLATALALVCTSLLNLQ